MKWEMEEKKGHSSKHIFPLSLPHLCFHISSNITPTPDYKYNHKIPYFSSKINPKKKRRRTPFSNDPTSKYKTKMALQNVHNKEMNLVLSSDAKPRLKWTSELHQRFVDAVDLLGGAEKATPKSLMRIMGIHGLNLYHLKSHLQKYRLGRSQQLQMYHQKKQEEYGEKQGSHFSSKICDGAKEKINENLQIKQALQMQMEVQRKLHEQIQVQEHLQLRIEAQGKYLQSILKKAQDTLSEYSSCSIEIEHAKAQLSELASMVNSGCQSSSFFILTQGEDSMLKDEMKKSLVNNGCSLESSITSSEGGSESKFNENEQVKRSQLLENIDLNCEFLNDFDSSAKVIDLNTNEVGFLDGNF